MREITANAYFRAVDTDRESYMEKVGMKRKMNVAPDDRHDRDTIIEDSMKYTRLSKKY